MNDGTTGTLDKLVEENFKLSIIVHNDGWASKKILNDRNIAKNGEIA